MIHATHDYLRGRWLVGRIIENVADRVIGEFWGEADFSDDDQGLACHERGVLRFAGEDRFMERVSLWRFPEPGRVEVRHADGRPFHAFLTRQPFVLSIEDDAECEIVYEFRPGSWTSHWRLLAPGRDYEMTTRYRR